MNHDLLRQVRDGLPRRLNCGILMGDGGFCATWAGCWPLQPGSIRSPCTPTPLVWSNPASVVPPSRLSPASTTCRRDEVEELARLNDATPGPGPCWCSLASAWTNCWERMGPA